MEDAARALAAAGLVRVGERVFVGSGGEWALDVVGDRAGWSRRGAGWRPATAEESARGMVVCLVGGSGEVGSLAGLAECREEHVEAVGREWHERYGLRVETSFLGKVVTDGQLTLAPLDLIFCRSETLALAGSKGLAFVNRWSGKQRRVVSEHNLVNAEDQMALTPQPMQSQAADAVLGDDSDLELPRLAQGLDDAEQANAEREAEESDRIWREICAVSFRPVSSSSEAAISGSKVTSLRDVEVGRYVPVQGLSVAASFCVAEWTPKPPNLLLLDDQGQTPMADSEKSHKKKRSRKNAEELMEQPPAAAVAHDNVHLLNQWVWPESRELLWRSVQPFLPVIGGWSGWAVCGAGIVHQCGTCLDGD